MVGREPESLTLIVYVGHLRCFIDLVCQSKLRELMKIMGKVWLYLTHFAAAGKCRRHYEGSIAEISHGKFHSLYTYLFSTYNEQGPHIRCYRARSFK